MTKRWTATKSNVQPKRLASKRDRASEDAEVLAALNEAHLVGNWWGIKQSRKFIKDDVTGNYLRRAKRTLEHLRRLGFDAVKRP